MTPSERILFIDDELPVRTAFARTLRRQGLEVDLAGTHEEALELASKTPYAVIATDYRMPDTDGLTLSADLQKLQPLASFMLVSGECDLSLAVEAVNEHGIGFLVTKPWDGTELTALMHRAVTAHQERALQARLQQSSIENNRTFEDQKRRLQEAVERSEVFLADILLGALDLRNHETRAHCRRVATYARMLAEATGASETLKRHIYQGALLHDVGKIGVPDKILLKPGPLDPDEWAIMRQHCEMGAKLLEGFDALAEARDIVLQHHERWDGAGYPMGLRGKAICFGARIFAVVDALDAMLSDRPYRKAMTFEAALKQIVTNSGTQFDPEIVDAFLRIPRETWLEVRKTFSDDPAQESREAA